MSTDNIDDLFRRQLDGHETPPGDDLWARLQAGPGAAAPGPAPERVDQLFRQGLHTHATPPPRELWERLEDEHLRPRKRRAAAWWPMALAAAVALLLLAGGVGLWRGFPGGTSPAGTVASQSNNASRRPASTQQPTDVQDPAPATQADQMATTAAETSAAAGSVGTAGTLAAASSAPVSAGSGSTSEFSQKKMAARATRPAGPASSATKAGMMAQQSPRRPRGASRQPDAATAPAPLVARTTAPSTTPARPRPTADEPAPVVAATTPVAPAPEIVRPETPAPAALAANSVISVDVRAGAPARPSLGTAVATAAAAVAEERRGLGGRLLRQVGHAVRGERISLAEVTGLPENLTLEANIGRRRVSKSIQL